MQWDSAPLLSEDEPMRVVVCLTDFYFITLR